MFTYIYAIAHHRAVTPGNSRNRQRKYKKKKQNLRAGVATIEEGPEVVQKKKKKEKIEHTLGERRRRCESVRGWKVTLWPFVPERKLRPRRPRPPRVTLTGRRIASAGLRNNKVAENNKRGRYIEMARRPYLMPEERPVESPPPPPTLPESEETPRSAGRWRKP